MRPQRKPFVVEFKKTRRPCAKNSTIAASHTGKGDPKEAAVSRGSVLRREDRR